MKNPIISQILVDHQGWKYDSEGKLEFIKQKSDTLLSDRWIRHTLLNDQGVRDYNCRHVVEIRYKDEA